MTRQPTPAAPPPSRPSGQGRLVDELPFVCEPAQRPGSPGGLAWRTRECRGRTSGPRTRCIISPITKENVVLHRTDRSSPAQLPTTQCSPSPGHGHPIQNTVLPAKAGGEGRHDRLSYQSPAARGLSRRARACPSSERRGERFWRRTPSQPSMIAVAAAPGGAWGVPRPSAGLMSRSPTSRRAAPRGPAAGLPPTPVNADYPPPTDALKTGIASAGVAECF